MAKFERNEYDYDTIMYAGMRMNERELRKFMRGLVDTANKRLSALEKREADEAEKAKSENREAHREWALDYMRRYGKDKKVERFSTKRKGVNQLRAELKRVTGFLTARSTTASGKEEIKEEAKARTETMLGVQLSDFSHEQVSKFWDLWHELRKKAIDAKIFDYATGSQFTMELVQRNFFKHKVETGEAYTDSNLTSDELLKMMKKELARLEEEELRRSNLNDSPWGDGKNDLEMGGNGI